MTNLERDNLIDGFFNKGYACDLNDVYQAVIGTIKELEQANDEKDKEIERLNKECDTYMKIATKKGKIINKAIKYIEICRDYHKTYHKEEKIFPDEITSLLMILQGDDINE